MELHALQCLFVRGSNKQQRKGRIISNFTKGQTFLSFMITSALGVISECGPPSCTLQKRASSLQFGEEGNIPGDSTERRAYLFVLKIAGIFCIPTGRAGIG